MIQLKSKMIEALEALKAVDIIAIDVRKLTLVTDYMIVASGNSARHVRAVAEHMVQTMKPHATSLGTEGLDTGEWALVDFGDVVVHIMQPKTREFYQLERLWHPRNEVTALYA